MRWPWTQHASDQRGSDEAHAALEHAISQWPEVHATSRHIRRLRAENHFAEKIHRALEGRA